MTRELPDELGYAEPAPDEAGVYAESHLREDMDLG